MQAALERRSTARGAAPEQDVPVIVGRIGGAHGVRGWLRAASYTEHAEDILRYRTWLVESAGGWRTSKVCDGRRHGSGIVARLEDVNDRTTAESLAGARIGVDRAQLPALEPGQHYWIDLEGCRVVTTEGVELGVIDRLMETGANDVLVVRGERERLIPYVGTVVREVDTQRGRVVVDWDKDF